VYIGAAMDVDSGSMKVVGFVPSVCSDLVVDSIQQDGTLLIVRANRIQNYTWGCMPEDFGPLVDFPPVDDECPTGVATPPAADWGDIESLIVGFNTKKVCGYCEDCTYGTWNCVETLK
jgi:hypothetical protein